MNEGGVFSVARDIWSHPVLEEDVPFTRREAWLWLVSEAAWKPRRLKSGLRLERGEFSHSIRFLGDKWRWHRRRVERFLNALEREQMIRPRPDADMTENRDTKRDTQGVYYICNYNEYQLGGDEKRDTNRDSSGTAAGQQRDKEEPLNHSTSKSEPKEVERATRAAPTKGTRWSPDKVVPEDWIADADIQRHEHDLPRIDLRLEATRFANYWASKSGGAATKLDWHRTWINWALDNKSGKTAANGNGKHLEAHRIALAALSRNGSGHRDGAEPPFDPLPQQSYGARGSNPLSLVRGRSSGQDD